MRELAPGSQVTQRRRDPRLVVAIIFPVGSIYITNRGAYRQVPMPNLGFESGDFTGWNATPSATREIQSAVVRSGNYALAMSPSTAAQTDSDRQKIAVREGQRFRARCYINAASATGGRAYVNIRWENADGTLNSKSYGNAVEDGTAGWVLSEVEADVPADAAWAQVSVLVSNDDSEQPSGTWYIDDFRMDEFVGIRTVPGNVIHGALTDISSSSQALYPDDARTTIGTLSFTAVDLAGAITDELREQLRDFDAGVRLREVRIFTGDTDDFNDFERVETYVIDNVVELDGRSYRFQCSDRNREQRVDIFEHVKTRLDVTLSETETTAMTVQSTGGFDMVAHTASFSHRPNETVGYLRVRKTGEIIAYTGKTGTTFTGLERGCFGTRPQEVVVDPSTAADKRPEIEEVIYLEMPGPELDYAIMTGKILSSGASLPSGWHMAIDEAHVDADSFEQIGTDLYDPDNLTRGFILRFLYEEKQDGKRFLEEQVRLPCGTVCVVDSMGRFVLRRMVSLISTAQPNAILFDNNIIEHGPARYNLSRLINQVVFDWNFDGERYTRTNLMINAASAAKHKKAKPKTIKLRGLHVNRHSVATLRRIFATLTDRYGAPPIEMTAKLSRSMNQLEIADVPRVILGRVRDHTAAGHLDRTFEIQRRSMNWKTGELNVTLFGSTARPTEQTGGGTESILDDSWYTSEETDLSNVLTIVDGVVTADGSLTGADDLRDAVYYYAGDLTIPSGVTVTISDNVQLRIRGELTVHGKIDGKGQGLPPTDEWNEVGSPFLLPHEAFGLPITLPTIGSTRGSAGVWYHGWYGTVDGLDHRGQAAVPRPALAVENGGLIGLPSELRGTPGVPGGPIVEASGSTRTTRGLGGAGGASGAGLMIICRGLSFGAGGEIDLSGDDGEPPANFVVLGGTALYAGAGGGGAPGGLLVVLDGDQVPLPDLSSSFTANRGDVLQTGNPIWTTGPNSVFPKPLPDPPWTGWHPGLGAFDSWEAAHLAVHVPSDIELGASDDEITPPPRDLAAVGDGAGVRLSWDLPPSDRYDVVELFESITNDRSDAVLIFRGRASSFTRTSDSSVTRYYWVRARDDVKGPSEWEPASATGGVQATFGGAVGPQGSQGPPGNDGADGADGEDAVTFAVTASNGIQFRQAPNNGAWSGTTTDITFTFFRGGVSIASHVVRVTRSGANLTAATFGTPSGEATTLTTPAPGSGTPVVTLIVTHNASGVATAQSVSTVQGGDQGPQGDEGPAGPPGADGADGLSVAELVIYRRSASAPATPTGGSFNFGTQALTPPTNWSAGIPSGNNPIYASTGLAAIQGTTGVDSSITWSTPVLLAQEGSAVDIIFRRSATQPSTPGASSGVPSGWSSDVSSAPGAGLLWSSVGTRPNAGANWTWQTPIQVEGEDGAQGPKGDKGDPGAAGADGEDFWTPVLVNVSRSGKTFSKTGGSNNSWDASVYSAEGYASCQMSFRPGATNAGRMIGLSSNPTADNRFETLDHAFYCDSGGFLTMYESGSSVGSLGSYSADEDLTITYDGYHVRYWRNNVLVRTAAAVGKIFHLDSSFFTAGASVQQLYFAKGDVGKIDLETKVTGVLTAAFAGFTVDELPGSVAVGQLTTNLAVAMNAVFGNLSAINADLGTVTAGKLNLPAQTFSPTWTGFSSPPAGVMSYIDFGAVVVLYASADRIGTANANTMSFSGLPTAIRPSTNREISTQCIVTFTAASPAYQGRIPVVVRVQPDGQVVFMRLNFTFGEYLPNQFNSTNLKGLMTGWTLLYPK